MVCPDYDLCQSCEGKGIHTEHDMMKITKPVTNPMGPFGAFFPGGPGCQNRGGQGVCLN